jgi:hypothetical protein
VRCFAFSKAYLPDSVKGHLRREDEVPLQGDICGWTNEKAPLVSGASTLSRVQRKDPHKDCAVLGWKHLSTDRIARQGDIRKKILRNAKKAAPEGTASSCSVRQPLRYARLSGVM